MQLTEEKAGAGGRGVALGVPGEAGPATPQHLWNTQTQQNTKKAKKVVQPQHAMQLGHDFIIREVY